MAVDIEVVSKKIFTQYRNGNTFSTDTSENTLILQGGVGAHYRLEEVVKVTVIVNASLSIPLKYLNLGAGAGVFTSSVDFNNQGLVAGQVCDLIQGTTNSGEITINGITGSGNSTLLFDDTNVAAFLNPGDTYLNLEIKVKTVPDYLRYQYGEVASTSSVNNYDSPLDGTTQAYVQSDVTGVFKAMPRVGFNQSWDKTDLLDVKFNSTSLTYTHEFEIRHQFRTTWYKEAEFFNLFAPLNNPADLDGIATRKYVNGFFFGYNSPEPAAVMEDNFGIIGSGNLGYYNEALNGFLSIYTLTSLTITNPSGTGVLEVSEANVVVAVITASSTIFTATQRAIVNHSRATTDIKAANLPQSSDTVYVRDSLLQNAGDAPVASTIISAMTVVQTSTSIITVTFTVSYSGAEQDLIDAGESYILWLTVDNQVLTAVTERPVDILLEFDRYSKNLDQTGQITNWQPKLYNAFNAYAGGKFNTDWKGWDGDIVGIQGVFDLTQTLDGNFRRITSMKSRIVADNGTIEFEVFSKTLPVDPQVQFEGGGYIYRIVDIDEAESVNIPSTEPIARRIAQSVPAFPPAFQTWTIKTIMPRISWRGWVFNPNVPTSFFDNTEPQDNLNQKTSNYQASGFVLEYELTIEVTKFEPGTATGISAFEGGFVPTIITTYKCRGDHLDILDFDVDGGLGFSAVTNYFDINGDATTNLFTDQVVRVEIEFTHASGTLPVGDLSAYIWIERDGGTTEPFQLHTDLDWTLDDNPLSPSNTLLTGNTQFVEIVSALNLVTIICNTNPDNLSEGVLYNVYGRLAKET